MITTEYAYARFCKERFPPPSEDDVLALEGRMGIELPPEYRQYVLEFNGGYFTEPDIAPVVEGCPVDCLTYMHGIGASHPSAELGSKRQLAIFKEEIDQKPDVVPIGYTLMGNFILLVTQPDGRGDILLRTFNKSFFLSETVDGFFELLREPVRTTGAES